MEQTKKLFAKKKLKKSKILHESKVIRDPVGEIKVELTEIGLEEKSANGWSSITFDFDIKFSFTLSPPTIRLEKEEENAVFQLASEAEV